MESFLKLNVDFAFYRKSTKLKKVLVGLKSLEELNEYFLTKNIDKKDDIIATCGSGVSACVISIALYCLGKEDVPIYDGSWTEWASSGQEIRTSV